MMKKTFVFIAIAGILFSCGSNSSATKVVKQKSTISNPIKYAKTITIADLKTHLTIYASDEFEGRETGTPGQVKAINYLKKNYMALGLTSPIGQSYFQEVPLLKKKTPTVQYTINGVDFKNGEDFVSFSQAKNTAMNFKEIEYVGYGVDDTNYSDYSTKDVKGKIVLIKVGEPKNADGTYKVSGTTESSSWSEAQASLKSKSDAAKKHGAKGLLFYVGGAFPMLQQYYKGMQSRSRMDLRNSNSTFYNSYINSKMAKTILNTIDTNDKHQTIQSNGSINYKGNSEELVSHNVLAHIKGSEKPDEYIVISAHLDHEGVKNGEIYNGADDDGSGTVAILEIAQAFKEASKDGHRPKRSILFLHVTGEEKGLLGSRHYTDNDPIIPLANTVANLNIDMIGRADPKRTEGNRNYIYLIGADKLSTELHTISEEMNTKYTNIELDYTFNNVNDPNRFYYRSDHYNFAKNNIPVIFYFNGTHDDYHQPSDTVEKIQFDLLENRTRLIFHTAWELANRAERIVVDKAE